MNWRAEGAKNGDTKVRPEVLRDPTVFDSKISAEVFAFIGSLAVPERCSPLKVKCFAVASIGFALTPLVESRQTA